MLTPGQVEVVREYYRELNAADLASVDWKFRHFKFRKVSGRFMRLKDSISQPEQLLSHLQKHCPADAFFSPVKWLDPVMVNRSRGSLDVMLNDPLFIDIDQKDQLPPTWQQTSEESTRLIEFIYDTFNKNPDLVVFSGRQGFHIYYWNWDGSFLTRGLVHTRPLRFIKKRKRLFKLLATERFKLDKLVLTDPYRVLRVPGSISSKSLLKTTVLSRGEILSFKPVTAAIQSPTFYSDEGLVDWEIYE